MYPQRLLSIKTIAFLSAVALSSSGCTTMVSYAGKAKPLQSLKYTQGVGTVSEKSEMHEVFMYPTFRTQGTTMPTFTIGFGNNSADAVNFDTSNIKAYFRGQPIQIYTYTERIAEIEREKQGKQVALAIVGGLAAGAAAYNASHRSYNSSYSGFVSGRRGVTSFGGTQSIRVYDPLAGAVAGAAVGGATGLGIQQLEYNAQNQERAADAILQANTVDPLRFVTGDIILKDCCDPYGQANDLIRFEVTVNGKVSTFEFERVKVSK